MQDMEIALERLEEICNHEKWLQNSKAASKLGIELLTTQRISPFDFS